MQRYDKVDRQNLPLGISGGITLLKNSNLSREAIKPEYEQCRVVLASQYKVISSNKITKLDFQLLVTVWVLVFVNIEPDRVKNLATRRERCLFSVEIKLM